MQQFGVSHHHTYITVVVVSTLTALFLGCGDAAAAPATHDAQAADAAISSPDETSTDASTPDPGDAAPSAALDAGTVDADPVPTKPETTPPSTGEAKPPAMTAETPATERPGETTALANPAPGSKFFVGANFWNIGWQGSSDYFTNGANFATTDNPWRADFLKDLAPYHVLRFMDWTLTNTSDNAEARWDTRLQKTDSQRDSVALEWQIDLCNRTKTDCWITVPHESGPDYWTRLAKLFHDTLDPSLRVYVEWSNEVWNSQFPQRAYAQSQGQALGLAGEDKASAFYVYRAVRVFDAFEAEFGKDNPRLVKVLAGQAAWSGPCEAHLTALADPKINPNHTRASAYAIAPYPKGGSITELRSSLREVESWIRANATCASKANLPLIAYEGGPDSFGSDNGRACRTLQRDPGMREVYSSFLDSMYNAKLLGPFMQYTHSGACWGLKESTNDDLASSPKYQALVDWIAAHP